MKTLEQLRDYREDALSLKAETAAQAQEIREIVARLDTQIQQQQVKARTLHALVTEVETLLDSPRVMRDFTSAERMDGYFEFQDQLSWAGTYAERIQIAVAWRAELRGYTKGQ